MYLLYNSHEGALRTDVSSRPAKTLLHSTSTASTKLLLPINVYTYITVELNCIYINKSQSDIIDSC